MAETIEKIYCTEHGNNDNLMTALACMGGRNNSMVNDLALLNGGYNNQWNNPMMYLVWMWMMRWMNGGMGYDGCGNGYGMSNATSLNEVQRQIANLQNGMQDNHNTDLIMSGIRGNESAIREASQSLGCDFNALNLAVQNVASGIKSLEGITGFTGERIINAITLGDSNLMAKLSECCCSTQKEILRMDGDMKLSNCQQTNALQSAMTANTTLLSDKLRDLGNGISQGFASTAYETQRQTCDIKNAIYECQQKTADLLQTHWQNETSQALQDAKFEISQLKQNQYLASLVGSSNGGCSCASI